MTLCLPYKGTILQGLGRDDYTSQRALLPLSGGIAPFPVGDAVEASDSARPGLFRALPQSRDEAVTGLGRRARQGAPEATVPPVPLPSRYPPSPTPAAAWTARDRLPGAGVASLATGL